MMKKSFWYNSDQNGNLLKPRTGHVVDIDNMFFAISGLSNCTVSTYRFFFQCTMCTLFSLMPLYLGICHGGNMPVGHIRDVRLARALGKMVSLYILMIILQFRKKNSVAQKEKSHDVVTEGNTLFPQTGDENKLCQGDMSMKVTWR